VQAGVKDLGAERREDGARGEDDWFLEAPVEDYGAVDDAPLGRTVEGSAEKCALPDRHEAVWVHQRRVAQEGRRADLSEAELQGGREEGEDGAGDGVVLRVARGLCLDLAEVGKQPGEAVDVQEGVKYSCLPGEGHAYQMRVCCVSLKRTTFKNGTVF